MVILIMGVSGTGKTSVAMSLAAECGFHFIEADDYHSKANIVKMFNGMSLSDDDRLPWLLSINAELKKRKDQNIVLACSALKLKYRESLFSDILDYKIIHLSADYDIIYQRMLNRNGHFMPPSLLKDQFDTLEHDEEAILFDVGVNTVKEIVSEIKKELSI